MFGKYEAEIRELKLMAQLYKENGEDEKSKQALQWGLTLADDEFPESEGNWPEPEHKRST